MSAAARGEVISYDDVEDLLGPARAASVLADAIGWLGAQDEFATELAVSQGREVYLDPMLGPDDAGWLRRYCAGLLADRRASWLEACGLPRESASGLTYADLRFALPLALDDHLAADLGLYDANERDVRAVARNLAGALEQDPGLDVAIDVAALASDLQDRFGLWYFFDTPRLVDGMSFDMTLMLDGRGDDLADLVSSVTEWMDGSMRQEKAEDGRRAVLLPGAAPWARPEGLGRTPLDALCESQGTTLGRVLAEPGATPFSRSLALELSESAVAGAHPSICIMVRADVDAFVQLCAAMDSRALGLEAPAADVAVSVPAGAGQPKVGIYDPVSGAGALMEIVLDRDFEVPLEHVWLAKDEPEHGDTFDDPDFRYWTPQDCFGFCEPFSGRLEAVMAPASPGEAMTAPVGAAELDAPEEMENDGPDLDRYSSDDIVEMTDRWLEGPAGPMDGAHGPAMAFAAPVAGAPEQQLTSAEDPAEEK